MKKIIITLSVILTLIIAIPLLFHYTSDKDETSYASEMTSYEIIPYKQSGNLDLGTIVSTDDGGLKLMIYGRDAYNPSENRTYDYLVCMYPQGFMGDKLIFFLNDNDIKNEYRIVSDKEKNEEKKIAFRESPENILEEFHVGTIVSLKDSSDKIIIYGRTMYDHIEEKSYDYIACPYPKGYEEDQSVIFFNTEDIEYIYVTK